MHTNNHFGVYAVTRGSIFPFWVPKNGNKFEQWIPTIPNGDFIAWFHGQRGDYTAADLRGRQGFEIVFEAQDGTLFRVNRAHDPRPAYAAAYESVAANRPVARSGFDVHLDKRTLTYAKSPCAGEEIDSRFLLHIIPVDVNDLPDGRERWGFDNLDFSFEFNGVRFDDACMVSVRLPAYPIAEVATGQFEDGARLWETSFPFPQ